mmetsp:Transcript_756/g.2025  ORF Transcript_756/g.2025 Transcript_756/m.2025 type:complete len:302 (-) Transcript_756:192-1097(-)
MGKIKAALRVMEEAGLSPTEAGRILYDAGDEVSVELLGACLGHHGDFWQLLSRHYPDNFTCFQGMDIVTAIRTYLWRFRLPGEALQIDRVISGFAAAFFARNPPPLLDARKPWDAGANGWYVRQPRNDPGDEVCCVHCGALNGKIGDLYACDGCQLVHFCRRCRKMASRQGHAVVGTIGYGRACVAALHEAGQLSEERKITFRAGPGRSLHKEMQTAVVSTESQQWPRVSPFQSEDAVMVLAFAIIMLTTNLHSINVKTKMRKSEFIKQNREVNAGANFPGDFLAEVYDNIEHQELQVMRK